jgi:type IV secretion system protein VirB10
MAENVIDRGGVVAPADSIPENPTPNSAKNGGSNWGNIALFGSGIALLATISGIGIGYGVFHHSATKAPTDEPAQASQRSVEDVLSSPAAQRAALAGQLGQANAPATDVFGRPIAGQVQTDANGNAVPTTTDANGNPLPPVGVAAGGTENLAQKRYEERIKMADAARRSPIMAFQNDGYASTQTGVSMSQASASGEGRSMVSGGQGLGASGFGPPAGEGPQPVNKATVRPISQANLVMRKLKRCEPRSSRTVISC